MTPLVSADAMRYVMLASPATCLSMAPRYAIERLKAYDAPAATTPMDATTTRIDATMTPIDATTTLRAAALRGAWVAFSSPTSHMGRALAAAMQITPVAWRLMPRQLVQPRPILPQWWLQAPPLGRWPVARFLACEALVATLRHEAMHATGRGDGCAQALYLVLLAAAVVCSEGTRLPWHAVWALTGFIAIVVGAGVGVAYALAMRWHAAGVAMDAGMAT